MRSDRQDAGHSGRRLHLAASIVTLALFIVVSIGIPAAAAPLAVGSVAPPFQAVDQSGRMRDLAELSGKAGLVIVFFRSADW